MPVRARVLALSAVLVVAASVGAVPNLRPAPVAAGGQKVAIIVGPVGTLTTNYRNRGNEVAAAATAAGATVVKAYSPNATWANVRAAVNGANVIVYLGHGNGYPNPYGSTELTDRTNGWGLNRTTTNGDADNWSSTMVYCGEKALLGTLTAADGAAQRQYCGYPDNDGISPAPGFTMIYAQAHYAPGFGERYEESDPVTTLSEARARVRHYSMPVLQLGAGGYIATAYSDADEIVMRVLNNPSWSYAQVFRAGRGYSASTVSSVAHADVAGAQVWVQDTVIEGFHFGDPDYWYAFAGNPDRLVGGCDAPFTDICGSPFFNDIMWLRDTGITGGCAATRFCPNSLVTRAQMSSFLVRALDLPPASQDYFSDDESSVHEPDINALHEAGVTGGCGEGTYCPNDPVTRAEMASFLGRAFSLPAPLADHFVDDAGSMHEANINSGKEAAILGGCASDRYCPGNAVTRGQMAAFLHRALT